MKYRFSFIFFLLCFFSACKKGFLADSGRTVVIERPVSAFNRINLFHNINLILTQDTADKIRIEAGENIQSSILTEVSNKELTIKNASNSLVNKPNETINVYVSVKNLGYLNYQGAGNVSSTNRLQAETFYLISNTGAGNVKLSLDAMYTITGIYDDDADFTLSGQSVNCFTYCSSRGTIDFRNFQVKNMEIEYSSVRNGYVSVIGSFKGRINYKGNVYYKGSPSLQLQTANEGRFIPY